MIHGLLVVLDMITTSAVLDLILNYYACSVWDPYLTVEIIISFGGCAKVCCKSWHMD